MRLIFILLGLLATSLGFLGMFLPGLPTTPFLLLATGLFAKSSPRLNNFLLNNKYFGAYIKRFQEEKGMTKKSKIYSISMLWTMVSISVLFLIKPLIVKIIVVVAGIIGTVVMGFILKTIKPTKDIDKEQQNNNQNTH